MKNTLRIFIGIFTCTLCADAIAAVSIKKAAPVATQATTTASAATSLLPTVLNLVNNVQALTAKQKALTNECIPSSQEITWVNNMMKEWAKTGAMSARDAQNRMGYGPCGMAGNIDSSYAVSVRRAAGIDGEDVCYDSFTGAGNDENVWARFPMASVATVCSDGADTCSANSRQTVSNIYDVFNLIDFSTEDYTKAEATVAAKLLTKIETCSYSKLSAKKREMWGEFLGETIGGLGQKQNTASVMEMVQGVAGGGGLSSIGGIATQLLNK